MAAVMRAAGEAGYPRLTGKTHARNLGMRALYRKFGFEAAHITMEWRAGAGDADAAGAGDADAASAGDADAAGAGGAEAEGAGTAGPGGPGGGGGQ
jgi:hypothetical protein